MIRASQVGGAPFRRGGHGRGVVAADIEEAAQLVVAPADQDDRFAGRGFAGDVLARPPKLVNSTRNLPGTREHRPALQVQHARVRVPLRGNRGRVCQRCVALVASDDVCDWMSHERANFIIRARHARWLLPFSLPTLPTPRNGEATVGGRRSFDAMTECEFVPARTGNEPSAQRTSYSLPGKPPRRRRAITSREDRDKGPPPVSPRELLERNRSG